MENRNQVVENISNPHELELLYRKDPKAFREAFTSAIELSPDSEVLAAWDARLRFEDHVAEASSPISFKDAVPVGLLALLSGTAMRIIVHFVEAKSIAPANLVFSILPFIAAYFIYAKPSKKAVRYWVASLFAFSIVYLNLLPLEQKDPIILSYLHLPIFLWVLVGLAFTGDGYRDPKARIAYLRFNGEFGIIYGLMAIAGAVLTALTLQLFGFLGIDIFEFYFRNVVLFGAAFLAIVAAYLVTVNSNIADKIAPFIARIFSPLVLATLMGFLITLVFLGKNPFLDRDFLLLFNVVLFLVLAVTIFTLVESGKDEKRSLYGFVNLLLIVLALIVDSVALSAILFRLSSYGITPNRVAVLGMNLLIWVNLIVIVLPYVRFLRNKVPITAIQTAITGYLPIYGAWGAIVAFIFPLLFR